MHIFNAKDNKPVFASMSYYGVIENICELDYTIFLFPYSGISRRKIIMASKPTSKNSFKWILIKRVTKRTYSH